MPEREVKLTPSPGYRLPSLNEVADGVIARPDEILELQAVYYDTADVRLARSGASLRYRDPEGWTVKLPTTSHGDLLVRGEHTFPGEPGDPPAAAVDLVRAWVRTAPVHAIARLKTRRRRIDLIDAGGKRVAEVVDDEVSVLDDGRITSRFRELEVELGEDAPVELADLVVARLQAAGAAPADPTPKIVRALGMRAVAAPDVEPPGDLSPDSPARDVVHAAIASSVLRLLTHDPGVRLGDDPEQVHQARVATRRLRSDLRTFRSLLVPEWDEALREELRWLGAELGAVRDTEVLLDLLRSRVRRLSELDRPVGERLVGRLLHRWEDARVELLDALRSARYAQLLDRLVDAAREPALLPAADAPAIEVLPDLARRPWRKLRRAVEALPEDPPDEQLHAVRIRAKRSRYAAEAVAPALGPAARDMAKAVAGLQDVLGDHQDAVVAGNWLRSTARDTESHDEVFVAGMLTGMIRVIERRTPQGLARGVEGGPPQATPHGAVTDREVRAAGGVVLRRDAGGNAEVLLVHRPRYDDWSLPKGKCEPGETDEACARREVLEETGVAVELGDPLPEVRYRDHRDRPKVVRYWVMRPTDDPGFVPNDEVDEIRWCSIPEARDRLSYAHDRDLVTALRV